ncbi:MAG: hypothetical protein QXJ68_04095 [Methanocellales archaeon]
MTYMENVYVIAVVCGFVFGAFIGRFITKLKLALIYESRLKAKRALENTLDGGE